MKIGFIEQATPEVILAREAADMTGGSGRFGTKLKDGSSKGMNKAEEEMDPAEVRMSYQSELSLTQAVPVSQASILLLII